MAVLFTKLHVHTYVHVDVQGYGKHVRTYINMACTYVHMHVRTHVCTCAYMYVHVYWDCSIIHTCDMVVAYVCTCACTVVRMYMYIM